MAVLSPVARPDGRGMTPVGGWPEGGQSPSGGRLRAAAMKPPPRPPGVHVCWSGCGPTIMIFMMMWLLLLVVVMLCMMLSCSCPCSCPCPSCCCSCWLFLFVVVLVVHVPVPVPVLVHAVVHDVLHGVVVNAPAGSSARQQRSPGLRPAGLPIDVEDWITAHSPQRQVSRHMDHPPTRWPESPRICDAMRYLSTKWP